MKKTFFLSALALAASLSGCVIIDDSGSGDGFGPAFYRAERLQTFQSFRCDNGYNVTMYRHTAERADFTFGVRTDRNTFTVNPVSSSSGEYSVSGDRRIQWRQFDSGRADFSFTDRNGNRQSTTCNLAR